MHRAFAPALLAGLLLGSPALAASSKDTLVIQASADVPTLDPAIAYDTTSLGLIAQMYDTLLTYEGTSLSRLKPMLATRWAATDGGRRFTFTLRPNVKFHSGAPFTCADAEYTFRRNLVTNSSESSNWFLAESLLGTSRNANDDKTITWARIQKAVQCTNGQLVFTLPKADPAFLSKLVYTGQVIVNRAYSASIGEWDGTEKTWKAWVGKLTPGSALSRKPNGTGPYQLVRADATTHLFTAFSGYWGNPPAIKQVLRQRVAEPATRQQAFLRGDADLIEGSGRAADEAQMRGRPGVGWTDGLPSTQAWAILMNQQIKPGALGSGKLDGKGVPPDFFKDAALRQAFTAAFNYGQYIRDQLKGQGFQRTMLLPETFPGYDPSAPKATYDPKRATELFRKAWGGKVWSSGFTLTAHYRAGSAAQQTALEVLKSSIESINPKFRINVQPKPWSDLLSSDNRGREPLVMMGWSPDYADADNFVYTFYHSKGYYGDWLNWNDATADRLIDQARSTVTPAQRNGLYRQLARRAYAQAPFILIPAEREYRFYRSEVTGWVFNPILPVAWKDLVKR